VRRRLFFVLLIASCTAWAQGGLPALEPLPEPAPPQEGAAADEPRVRIPVQQGDKIEPVRRNGVVIAVKVTPPNGKPYFLIDTSGNGSWMRRDSLDTGLAVPMFPILEFD
jgi:hypothetical protein